MNPELCDRIRHCRAAPCTDLAPKGSKDDQDQVRTAETHPGHEGAKPAPLLSSALMRGLLSRRLTRLLPIPLLMALKRLLRTQGGPAGDWHVIIELEGSTVTFKARRS